MPAEGVALGPTQQEEIGHAQRHRDEQRQAHLGHSEDPVLVNGQHSDPTQGQRGHLDDPDPPSPISERKVSLQRRMSDKRSRR